MRGLMVGLPAGAVAVYDKHVFFSRVFFLGPEDEVLQMPPVAHIGLVIMPQDFGIDAVAVWVGGSVIGYIIAPHACPVIVLVESVPARPAQLRHNVHAVGGAYF